MYKEKLLTDKATIKSEIGDGREALYETNIGKTINDTFLIEFSLQKLFCLEIKFKSIVFNIFTFSKDIKVSKNVEKFTKSCAFMFSL